MNERFEKLLAEAFFDEVADQVDTKVYKLNDAVMQKFARLIVEECADVCHQIDHEYDGEDVSATWCAKDILKHFGVER